ncbi:MAG: CcoQ/FixQ family Cbb3-type cytochrome c oxidase assembly chaperone [Myxococcales bacterium]|nr:CcoQ/FixQ family Cbb3-type cytochrome c oxidase assembly chaperone [Myxococcales bacterium]
MEEWVGIYKFARLAVLALALAGIAFHLYRKENRERFEEPARRMLEEDPE